MDSIGRKHLMHEVPPDVLSDPGPQLFFITICCVPRSLNQLAHPHVWQVIRETLDHRETTGDLRVDLALAMPDHFHALISFPKGEIQRKISSFKEWVAKKSGVRWQRDFFDHRIRSWESAAEKAEYIRQNPVRAGLVPNPDAWPFKR